PPPHPRTDALSLHDALPIYQVRDDVARHGPHEEEDDERDPEESRDSQQAAPTDVNEHGWRRSYQRRGSGRSRPSERAPGPLWARDRKSTRLNSSHVKISYAV